MLMNKNVTLGATKLAKAMIKLSLLSFCYADLKMFNKWCQFMQICGMFSRCSHRWVTQLIFYENFWENGVAHTLLSTVI